MQRKYEMKGRNTVASQTAALRDGLEEMMKKVIEVEADYVCITTDMWTSANGTSFISITLHYLTKDFTMKSFTLEVAPFTGAHTGDNIRDFIEGSMARWRIEKKKIVILFRDNGSKIVKAARLMNLPDAGCIGHGLHLVVGTFLSDKKSTNNDNDVNEDKKNADEDKNDERGDDDGDGVCDYPPVDLENVRIDETEKKLQKKFVMLFRD